MKLSEKQEDIFDEIREFLLKSDEPLFVFSGVAGSGKSTIINQIVDLFTKDYKKRVAVLAYTGKAAKVLRSKGVCGAQTIHSYLYDPIVDQMGNLIGFTKKRAEDFTEDYIIIDEGSMVPEELLKDLYSLNRKILLVGDVNQLPPITKDEFNPMEYFNVRLEEIHRQAEDNPIIQLSQHILHEGMLPQKVDNEFVRYIRLGETEKHLLAHGDLYETILCGTNKIRTKLNKTMRKFHGFKDRLPEVGEKVICLRNNTRNGKELYNGDIATIMRRHTLNHGKNIDLSQYSMLLDNGEYCDCIVDDDIWFNGYSKHNHIDVPSDDGGMERRFLDKFDLGSCVSVWKSQGSEYKNLLFYDENVSYFVDRTKFRYTAVTRAKEKITIAR